MLNCDEIVIELSREQAVSSSGNSTWSNVIPDLILEVGDVITCEGGWISVSNSGDNSIEILDQQNPDNTSVDASFYVSYYKVMDSKNVVAMPYHSLRLTLDDENQLGSGFKKILPIGTFTVPDSGDIANSGDYAFEHYFKVPMVKVGDGLYANLTEIQTYDSLIHERDADKWDEIEPYTDFLLNTSLKQGMRDSANTGNYYTALYRKENGGYDLLQRKVEVIIPKGYYSPDNLASFITEQLQTKYFNEGVGNNPPETWTNSGRYVIGMTPVATPQINLGMTYGRVALGGSAQAERYDFLSTNSSPYKFYNGESAYSGIEYPISMSSGTGFSNYNSNIKIVNMNIPDNLPGDSYVPNYNDGFFGITWIASYITFEYKPTDLRDYTDWRYLELLASEWSGLNSKFHTDTNGTIYTPSAPYDNGFQIGCSFLINNIASSIPAPYPSLWCGAVYNTIGGDFNHPEISADILPIMTRDDGNQFPTFIVRTTIKVYNYTAFANYPAGQELSFCVPARPYPVTSQNQPMNGYVWDAVTYPNFADQFPDGLNIDGGVVMSAGGCVRAGNFAVWTPYRYDYRLPIGCPMYVGMTRQIDIGGAWGTTLVNNATGYAWNAFEVQNSIGVAYSPTSADPSPAIPADTPTHASGYGIDGTNMNYTNGNRFLGMTCSNFNRWSLKNNDEPPKVIDTPETEPNVMPILRKYPLFMKSGMETNTRAFITVEDTKVYSQIGDVIYPDYIDAQLSNLQLSPTLSADGKYIFTNNNYNAILPSGMTAVEAWYKFIQSQVQDGLIDIDAGTHTSNNIEYFYAYTHFCIAEHVEAEHVEGLPQNYEGSDDAIRNRPRGILVRIHKASYLKPTAIVSASSLLIPSLLPTSPQPFFSKGMLIAGMTDNTMRLGCPTYSWITSNSLPSGDNASTVPLYSLNADGINYTKTGDNLSSITGGNPIAGFGDYNIVPDGNSTIDLTATLSELQTSGVRMGWGYSYKKTGWRNFTSMLCSYALEESDATSYMFDSTANRMDKNANRFNPNNPDASEWGSLIYNPRIYLGADQASLLFDADGSSRFYWNNFFLTNKIGNKYYEGTENSTGGTLQPSIQSPFYTIYKGFTAGTEGTPDDAGNTEWSNDIPTNSQAGTEVIQYNKSKRSLYNDGLFQLAPEMTKHLPIIMGGNINMSEQGNYVSGNWFNYAYPVDCDLRTRFFCFDADVRYNTFALGEYQYDHSIKNSVNFVDFGKPNNIQPYEWNDWNETITSNIVTTEGARYLTPSRFWGSMSGDDGYIEKTSEAGTCRPNPLVIYDSVSGIQVFDWGNYTRENWTDSFWDTIGFTQSDMMPNPFQYCGQQRNYTTNFMTPTSNKFRTHSYPMRHDADLTDSGFVSITTTIQGQQQYVLQYPRKNYITSLGLQGINNLEQKSYTYIGGIPPYSLTGSSQYPFQYNAWREMASAGGGATLINGQLIPEEFAILYTESTKTYATDVADKLQSPFYLIRSNLAEDNFKYSNNSVVPSIHPIMGVISKQYGATSDWYYSTDSVNMIFTNRRRRVLNEVKISITEKSGRVANTIQPKSTIFFKIRRGIQTPDANTIRFDYDTENLTAIENAMDKKQHDLYEEEISLLLRGHP